MKSFRFTLLFAALLLTLALGPALRAAPATPPPADQKSAVVQPAPAPAKAEPVSEVAPPPPPPAAQPEALPAVDDAIEAANRLAEKTRSEAEKTAEKVRADAEPMAEKAQAGAAAVQGKAAQAEEKVQQVVKRTHRHRSSTTDPSGDRVTVMDDDHVPAGEVVKNDAVAVMGDLIVDGEVMNDAVAVMGDLTINGTVHGDVVAVMGDLTLGPKAQVDGDAVNVAGEIHRDPGAMVKGQVGVNSFNSKFNLVPLSSWWAHGLKHGRPLAIGAHLGWLWIVTAFSVAFYALLALVFPGKIRSCGDKLAQELGLTILAGVLGILALPVLFLLLCITIIGLPVALLILPVGTLLIAMFGKAAIYGLVGRRLSGDSLHPALAVILGALLFVLLYLIPFVGLLLSLLVWFLGFGCAVLSIFTKTPKPAVGFPSTPMPPVIPAATGSAGFVPGTTDTAGTAVPSPAEPPLAAAPAPAAPVPLTADTLPRAGFWLRVAAAFLDFMLICIPAAILELFRFGPGLPLLLLVAYHVAMWKNKGTTIGGVICGLKVVRLDDRPIDWGVAIVRALTAFLSFIAFGLGFIWVAFDNDKQSWHDKVAGTTIVRVPKGTPLL